MSEGNDVEKQEEVDSEIRAVELVLNAFLYYRKYGEIKKSRIMGQLEKIPSHHRALLQDSYGIHAQNMQTRLEQTYSVLKLIVNFGATMFGEESMKAMRIHQLRRPSSEYMSKVKSTIRQIVREWSSDGKPERDEIFKLIVDELDEIFPNRSCQRHEIRIFVPGCGLGRLPSELIGQGYTVHANEFSVFMLLTSYFILNACPEVNQHIIYPFIFDRCNSWDYEDQLRPVTFPDALTQRSLNPEENLNGFSMLSGDFLEITGDEKYDVVVTCWFLDTANNIIEYIDRIYDILEANGVWINAGPLMYHFEGVADEISIELPYSEIVRLIRAKGFTITSEKRIESKYTVNRRCMLKSQFDCAYFVARKPAE